MQGYFITGTDTNIGKTFVATRLLEQLNKTGKKTLGFKPIASGCEKTPNGLRNEDALALQQAASIACPYELVNPFAFAPPIAPHIAAAQQQITISIEQLIQAAKQLDTLQPDVIVVEGAGGWTVPINDQHSFADFAKALNFPVILVVGMRLGCLNHAILSYQSIVQAGVPLAGWVANCIEPMMPYLQENIDTLRAAIKAPLIEVVPFQAE